jgi:hypothetical protein
MDGVNDGVADVDPFNSANSCLRALWLKPPLKAEKSTFCTKPHLLANHMLQLLQHVARSRRPQIMEELMSAYKDMEANTPMKYRSVEDDCTDGTPTSPNNGNTKQASPPGTNAKTTGTSWLDKAGDIAKKRKAQAEVSLARPNADRPLLRGIDGLFCDAGAFRSSTGGHDRAQSCGPAEATAEMVRKSVKSGATSERCSWS